MTLLLVVNPVTGAIIYSQLRNAFTYWLSVSRIPCYQAFDSC